MNFLNLLSQLILSIHSTNTFSQPTHPVNPPLSLYPPIPQDPNATIVERVIGRSQADQSEIQRGDRLIAANTFDTFNASAKITQR